MNTLDLSTAERLQHLREDFVNESNDITKQIEAHEDSIHHLRAQIQLLNPVIASLEDVLNSRPQPSGRHEGPEVGSLIPTKRG